MALNYPVLKLAQPRLLGSSIDTSKLTEQHGDNDPTKFAFTTQELKMIFRRRMLDVPVGETIHAQANPLLHFRSTRTDLILENLDKSPLYRGH